VQLANGRRGRHFDAVMPEHMGRQIISLECTTSLRLVILIYSSYPCLPCNLIICSLCCPRSAESENGAGQATPIAKRACYGRIRNSKVSEKESATGREGTRQGSAQRVFKTRSIPSLEFCHFRICQTCGPNLTSRSCERPESLSPRRRLVDFCDLDRLHNLDLTTGES
jgi:hypothetical protein